MKIILDAMGGDLAPEAPVLGAIDAVKAYGAEITLVGRGEEILEVMKKHGIADLPSGMEIANADDVVDMHDDPASVIHKRKNSSMIVGLKMLAEGKGDAFVSAGSTGALLTGATLGGNLTPIGASANIAAIGILRRHGETVSVKDFLRIGVPFTLAAVLAGYAYIWWVWGAPCCW